MCVLHSSNNNSLHQGAIFFFFNRIKVRANDAPSISIFFLNKEQPA